MHVCACLCACVCELTHVWRPEFNVGCLPPIRYSIFCCCWDAVSHQAWSEVFQPGWLASKAQESSIFMPSVLEVQAWTIVPRFSVVAGYDGLNETCSQSLGHFYTCFPSSLGDVQEVWPRWRKYITVDRLWELKDSSWISSTLSALVLLFKIFKSSQR